MAPVPGPDHAGDRAAEPPAPRPSRRDRGVPLLMLAFSPLLVGMGGLLAWLCLSGALFPGFLVVALACLFLGLVALANGLRAWGVFLPSHLWGVRAFLSYWTWAARRKPEATGAPGEEARRAPSERGAPFELDAASPPGSATRAAPTGAVAPARAGERS